MDGLTPDDPPLFDPVAMLDQAGAALASLVGVVAALYQTAKAQGLPDALAHDMALRWWETSLDAHGIAEELRRQAEAGEE